jgi:hypothetical protein
MTPKWSKSNGLKSKTYVWKVPPTGLGKSFFIAKFGRNPHDIKNERTHPAPAPGAA